VPAVTFMELGVKVRSFTPPTPAVKVGMLAELVALEDAEEDDDDAAAAAGVGVGELPGAGPYICPKATGTTRPRAASDFENISIEVRERKLLEFLFLKIFKIKKGFSY